MYFCPAKRISSIMGIRKSEDKEIAFQELFQENYSRLFYASFYLINNESEARDIVHDYFADLWKIIHQERSLTQRLIC